MKQCASHLVHTITRKVLLVIGMNDTHPGTGGGGAFQSNPIQSNPIQSNPNSILKSIDTIVLYCIGLNEVQYSQWSPRTKVT